MSSVSSTASAASPTGSPTQTGNSGTGGPSSPLLFFVALGFGVVFTNLWIIVGVKYCFRYNQRNRARLAGDDPDAVDLAAMPRQRRRREKNLMTMEEEDEKFPLTKYKTWRSTRAEEGLPTAGGINTTPSRAASVINLPRASEDEDKARTSSSAREVDTEKISPSEPSSPIVTRHPVSGSTEDQKKTATATVERTSTQDESATANADQIQTAIPAEQLPDPGDTCAICIDALEDDDDVRGLTCGHAFHASCVDPWLTSRRACCPLCKADYYTPKPRPEGETEEMRRRPTREEIPPTRMEILMGRRRGLPFLAFNRHFTGNAPPPQRGSIASTRRRTREQSEMTLGTTAPETEEQQQQHSWRTRMNLPRLPQISRIRSGGAHESGQTPTTPAQLEAGQVR